MWERVREYLRHVLAFYKEELYGYGVWWMWNIPFHVANLLIGIASFYFFSKLFAGIDPRFSGYGDVISFIITGMAVNNLLYTSLTVYYDAVAALYGGKVGGWGGVRLSRIDYLYLARIPPFAFIFARVSLRYATQALLVLAYIVAGVLIFGVRVNPRADLATATAYLLLGIAATSAIGLFSASMYWLLGTYRGVEPLAWVIMVLAPLVSGIYYPIEVLPEPLIWISKLLPHTYAVRGVRNALLYARSDPSDLYALLIFCLLIIPGYLLLRYSIEVARRKEAIW